MRCCDLKKVVSAQKSSSVAELQQFCKDERNNMNNQLLGLEGSHFVTSLYVQGNNQQSSLGTDEVIYHYLSDDSLHVPVCLSHLKRQLTQVVVSSEFQSLQVLAVSEFWRNFGQTVVADVQLL